MTDDIRERQLDYLVRKWKIPRDEASILLETCGVDDA